MIENTEAVDIAIVGAGPLGMALALALERGPSIALIDSRARGAWADDPRALALAHGSRQLLERLGAWNSEAATLIREIHVSQRGGFGRTRIAADDYGTPALGYVMRYRDLADALAARVPAASLFAPCSVEAIETGEESATLTLAHEGATRSLRAKLVVHAEGMPAAGPEVRVRDYQQQAIVAEVRTRLPHGHRAWERFTPDGPLALLPLGESYAVVFTVPSDKAASLLALGDARTRVACVLVDFKSEAAEDIKLTHQEIADMAGMSRADVERVAKAGVNAILVGESLMKSGDIAEKVKELIGGH